MGTSSTKKLTKYSSGTTIVTADVANSWFGGLSGSYEGSLLDADDPRVIGHVHDGENYDGHSGKIDLVNHVQSKLQHQNLADSAVEKNNVATFASQLDAIPEQDIDGNYYLNLSSVYDYIAAIDLPFEFADTNSDSVDDTVRQSNIDYDTTGLDFVYGSSKLDDMSDGTKGHERFLFDKSKGAFRAGSVSSTQWNDSNRGQYSVGLGRNGKASGAASFTVGSDAEASGVNSFAAGASNLSSGNNAASFGTGNTNASEDSLVAGSNNSVSGGSGNLVVGKDHDVTSSASFVSGVENTVDGEHNAVTGQLCDVGDDGNIASGYNNYIRGDGNSAFGIENSIKNDSSVTANGKYALIAGSFNEIKSESTIIIGTENKSGMLAANSAVFGSRNNVNGPNSLVFGDRSVGKVPGEFVHAYGRFASDGDAQASELTLRGQIFNPTAPPGIPLSIDGVGMNYPMDPNDAFAMNISLIGKIAGTSEAGYYDLKAIAFGPATAPPAVPFITVPMITYVFRTPYFNTALIGVNLSVGPGNTIQVQVFDQHVMPNFFQSRWVATVKLTRCRY